MKGKGGRRNDSGCERTQSICVVSAAICVPEHITETVRPVPTPPISPCCLLATSAQTHKHISSVSHAPIGYMLFRLGAAEAYVCHSNVQW